MKRGIVVTVAGLMLACVLPMAKAQEPASGKEKTVAEPEDGELLHEIAVLQIRLKEMILLQRRLHDELRAFAEKRRGSQTQPQTPTRERPVEPPVLAIPEKDGSYEQVVSYVGFKIGPLRGDEFLEVDNQVGSITIRSGQAPGYEVTAIIAGRAETRERAHEIAEQLVHITQTRLREDRGERVAVEKPESLSKGEAYIVMLEVITPRDVRIKLHQAVGDIRLSHVVGSIEASTQRGSIWADGLRGQVALKTDLGGIEFVVPEDFSATVQAKVEIGSIESNLPLEIVKPRDRETGSTASGVIGPGEGNASLMTNVGWIRIRSYPLGPHLRSGLSQ